MKKIHLSCSILLGLLIVSCDKTDISQEKTESLKNNNLNGLTQRQSSMFDYVESMHIDNGADCENNILIFPTWEKYDETIDALDQMIDDSCDAFDVTVPAGTTDDQYDVLCANAGFDEDNVLIKFENDLGFCSLRRKIASSEDAWLGLQGDGQWDANADPDNHFIDDETERTLLSINAEVIIGDRKSGYVYYKFTGDGGAMIEVHNWDLAAITQVSHGVIPTGNPNVVVIEPRKTENTTGCKTGFKDFKYVIYGSNRIKRKSKVVNNDSWSRKKISALTIGYKKKGGKWKRRRTLITAGLTDVTGSSNGFIYNDCTTEFGINKVKEKRRRRVKVKVNGDTFHGNHLTIGIHDDKIFSYHKQQGGLDVKMDYYEMPVY